MTNSKAFVLETMRKWGLTAAEALQKKSAELTGTQLNAEKLYIPAFKAACAHQNMKDRSAGFICKSSAGRVVRLQQPYNSSVYTDEPEKLPAQWGFVWSKDPRHALPFVAISTSPYMMGDCCIDPADGLTYRSKVDNNVHAPSAWKDGWEVVTDGIA